MIISIRSGMTIRSNTNRLFGLLFGPNRILGTALIVTLLILATYYFALLSDVHFTNCSILQKLSNLFNWLYIRPVSPVPESSNGLILFKTAVKLA